MSSVYCFGHVSTGVILRLKMPYPQPDGYAEVAETLENHAGEATGTALVLARLGVPVALEGNWIGDTPACRRTRDFLASRGIDVSGLMVKPGYAGVNEIVVSDGHTRTVFGRYIDLLFTTPQWEQPDPAKIRAAAMVSVDPAFGETTLTVARTAREAGRPVIGCDARHDAPLTALADAMVVSTELIAREYPAVMASSDEREHLFSLYRARCPGLVIFTSGSRPLWYARGTGGDRHEMAPFPIEVVDSAGAGDSFRGGLIYGMLQGWSDGDAIRFACAVAALICTTAPGCVHPPSLEQIEAFLQERGHRVPVTG